MDDSTRSATPMPERGLSPALTRRAISAGPGWSVNDVAYTAGDENRPLRDQHGLVSIVVIAAGSFRYRSTHGSVMLAPGALLLGNAGSTYECTFAHSPGDRCIHFAYTPDLIEEIAREVPAARGTEFRMHRIPPVPAILSLSARAVLQSATHDRERWEELALSAAGQVLGLLSDEAKPVAPRSRRDERRVSEVLQAIETRHAEPLSIAKLSSMACMSPYHFMRTFRALVGVSPYQYLLHTRLRQAALAVGETSESIAAIAYGAGFGDLSTFAKAFRRAFALTPVQFRAAVRAGTAPRAPARNLGGAYPVVR
jgi:AraC family transcriptional regulator